MAHHKNENNTETTGVVVDRKVLWVVLAVVLIFAVGSFLRLVNLGYMSYHHDESLHAKYSFYLYEQGRINERGEVPYRYDPVYHGPFLYHICALFFVLFGDSDFTGRLPMALFGILMMVFVYQLHHFIGRKKALWALAFVAVSPSVTYFSRFARQDVFVESQTIGTVLFALLYFRAERPARKWLWFCLMAFMYGLLYCTNESSYVAGAILCSFVVLQAAIRLLMGFVPKLRSDSDGVEPTIRKYAVKWYEFTAILMLYGIFSVFVYGSQRIPLTGRAEYLRNTKGDISRAIAKQEYENWMVYGSDQPPTDGRTPDKSDYKHGRFKSQMKFWGIFTGIVLLIALNVIRYILENRSVREDASVAGPVEESKKTGKKHDEEKAGAPTRGSPDEEEGALKVRIGLIIGNARLLAALAIVVSLFCFLFTTMFANGQGLVDGVTDYVRYWEAQKYKPRIAQAEYGLTYYIFILAIYDIGSLLLGVVGACWYFGLFAYRAVKRILSVTSDEDGKEPSLVFPLFLAYWTILALVIYAKLQERVPWLLMHQAFPLALMSGYFVVDLMDRFGNKVWRRAVVVVACLLMLLMFRANVLLLQRPDDPREMMVYVQSNENIRKIVNEVDQICFEAGKGKNLTMVPQGGVKPMTIGLSYAEWPLTWYFRQYTTGGISKENVVNIAKVDDHAMNRVNLGSEFEFVSYPFRGHWSVSFADEVLGPRWSAKRWKKYFQYFWYRDLWAGDIGAEWLMFYKKRQIRGADIADASRMKGWKLPTGVAPVKTWGSSGAGPGQFNTPRDVAVGPDGSVYVVDSGNTRVQKFSPDGEFLLQFGGKSPSEGQGDGLFTYASGMGPCGITVGADGMVYVTDTWGRRIQKFDSMGKYISSIRETVEAHFYGPRDVAVAKDGRMFLSDTGNKCIRVFDKNGYYMKTFGQFNEQVGICITPDDMLLVADMGNRRIWKFDLEGNMIDSLAFDGWDSPQIPTVEGYITVDGNGKIYATDSTLGAVVEIDKDWTRYLDVWGGSISKPTGIAVSPDGFVYVVDSKGNRVFKFKR